MSLHEDKINRFLKEMGFSIQLSSQGEGATACKVATVQHMSVTVGVILYELPFVPSVLMQISCFYVPKLNIAPLYRRLLSINGFSGTYFKVSDGNNAVGVELHRVLSETDSLADFKKMLDLIAQAYLQKVPSLIQEFQAPLQPS